MFFMRFIFKFDKFDTNMNIVNIVSRGNKGENGIIGDQGLIGDTGYIGRRGPIGPIGPKGNRGLPGPGIVGSNTCRIHYGKCGYPIYNQTLIYLDRLGGGPGQISECPSNTYMNGFGLQRCNNKGMRFKFNCCNFEDLNNKGKPGTKGRIGPKGDRGIEGPQANCTNNRI